MPNWRLHLNPSILPAFSCCQRAISAGVLCLRKIRLASFCSFLLQMMSASLCCRMTAMILVFISFFTFSPLALFSNSFTTRHFLNSFTTRPQVVGGGGLAFSSQTPSPLWGTPSINRGRVVVLTVLPFEAGKQWRGSLHASDGALLTSSSVHRGGGPPPE